MNSLYSQLQWLPRPPQEFSERLKSLCSGTDSLGPELRSLASYALDLNQQCKLAKIIDRVRHAGKSLAPLHPFRLAVLSNATMDLIVPSFVASAARHGIALEVIQPSYDQIAQEALDPGSKVNRSRPDAVLLALDHRALPLKLTLGDQSAATATLQGVLGYLKTLRDGIKANSNPLFIFQTIVPPVESLFGSLDRGLPGTLRNIVDTINRSLASDIPGSGDVLLDIAALAETVGTADWHDVAQWNIGKFPFSNDLIPLYADHVARTIASVLGKSRKVLILDLDNTVWGGVIGDDGLSGIKVAQGDARGEAHLALQHLALDLRRRGVVLAVSSKNTDEIARAPFKEHPEMLLKLHHFAAFHANWQDKATNIQAISEELSLGLDSMVFLDDNPVERGLVRRLLPEVAVPELPEDPAWYARTLAAGGYFESTAFGSEDLNRARFYHENAKRVSLREALGGVDAYLASLDMTIRFQPFNATGRARIVQLINKSNQFNLTTRRYTDPEIADVENDPGTFTLQVRLSDTFGDNGMISVIICRDKGDGVWEIDTWLMSCRVLGRKVEHVVLREIVKHARAAGIEKLAGVYIPTGRNGLVVDHYKKLGFTKVAEDESGTTWWEILVDEADPEVAPMNVLSEGFDLVEENCGV